MDDHRSAETQTHWIRLIGLPGTPECGVTFFPLQKEPKQVRDIKGILPLVGRFVSCAEKHELLFSQTIAIERAIEIDPLGSIKRLTIKAVLSCVLVYYSAQRDSMTAVKWNR